MTVPRATYRVQFGPGFGFDAAAEAASYVAALGVSHVYASPCFKAARGSTHGYDVVDHTAVSQALGGEAAWERLTAALRRNGLGLVLDIVPNHMAAVPENPLWWDVLQNGASARFAHFFDVDWEPPEARLRGTILLPILEDHYGRVLEEGLIRLALRDGGVVVRYRDHVLPMSPRSLPLVLGPAAEVSGSDELAFLARALARLPEPSLAETETRLERHRDLGVVHATLRRLLADDVVVAEALERTLERTEADPDALDELLDLQCYRLAYWRAGAHELGYRRFFDIDSLVALRMEDEEVFLHTHGRVLEWARRRVLDGLRVDHPDGLRRPRRYFERLRSGAPRAWIVAEKILEADESLPESWPVLGTTGYDFLNDVGALFVDPSAEEPLSALYREVTGESRDWKDVAVEAKRRTLREMLASDVERLAERFVHVCESRRRLRDYTRHELREVLVEVAAHLPVYRTYVDEGPAEAVDRAYVDEALAGARRERPDLDEQLLSFLRNILLAEGEDAAHPSRELRLRFQQLTGAVTAKSIEDTGFYSWTRFVALNEVGGAPDRFGLAPEDFHRRAAERQRRWPHGMLALSTHDTKRSEDVRARLFLLSEVPDAWGDFVRRWMGLSDALRGGSPQPDRNMEYLLYQTLAGAHPLSLDRALAYMEKASREAKVHTSWTSPDPEYDRALAAFVETLHRHEGFRTELEHFVLPLVEPGWVNSLAQKLVQLTAPGVPDVYQGSELWDLSLVDPDNRRPVDLALRRRLLGELAGKIRAPGAGARLEESPGPTEGAEPPQVLRAAGRRDEAEAVATVRSLAVERGRGPAPAGGGGPSPDRIWARREEGLPKLWVVRQALRLRAERPEAFGASGDYVPLTVEGPAAEHVVAFARGGEVVTVVPRLGIRLHEAGGWRGTVLELPDGPWSDRLTGSRWPEGPVPMQELLGRFPVALLERED